MFVGRETNAISKEGNVASQLQHTHPFESSYRLTANISFQWLMSAKKKARNSDIFGPMLKKFSDTFPSECSIGSRFYVSLAHRTTLLACWLKKQQIRQKQMGHLQNPRYKPVKQFCSARFQKIWSRNIRTNVLKHCSNIFQLDSHFLLSIKRRGTCPVVG